MSVQASHIGRNQNETGILLSVTDASEYGYFAKHDGNFCVLGDMQQLREDTVKKYPDVPYFILGHSMGSFLARQFIEKFGAGLKGAIIMGTGYQPNSTLDLAIGLTAVFQQARGGHYRSETINNMALGSYNKSFEPARSRKTAAACGRKCMINIEKAITKNNNGPEAELDGKVEE